MKSLREIVEEKEVTNGESLNEEALSIVLVVLGIPSVIALVAWAASLFILSYVRGLGGLTSKVIKAWRDIFAEVKKVFTTEDVEKVTQKIMKSPLALDKEKESERYKRAFEKELKNVFEAIEKKDVMLASIEFSKTPKNIQNNPDVYKVIISELSKHLKEPPIKVGTQGNDTYMAIKRIINIRVANAAVWATKLAMKKSLEKEKNEDEDLDQSNKEIEKDTVEYDV